MACFCRTNLKCSEIQYISPPLFIHKIFYPLVMLPSHRHPESFQELIPYDFTPAFCPPSLPKPNFGKPHPNPTNKPQHSPYLTHPPSSYYLPSKKMSVASAKCIHCNYTGRVIQQCTPCAGNGRSDAQCRACDGRGRMTYSGTTCLHCRGSGKSACWYCQGAGRTEEWCPRCMV